MAIKTDEIFSFGSQEKISSLKKRFSKGSEHKKTRSEDRVFRGEITLEFPHQISLEEVVGMHIADLQVLVDVGSRQLVIDGETMRITQG